MAEKVETKHLKKRGLETRMCTLCVAGERKLTLSTAMVTNTENETSTIVKRRYLPRRGTANDVGGIISDSSRKNTPKDSIILIESDTCEGVNTKRVRQ